MPKVKAVSPLFSQCINRIKGILKNINTLVIVERFKQTNGSQSDSNPFHRIPTALLEVIIRSLSYCKTGKNKQENFNIEFLVTTELKKLIFPEFYCFKHEQYLNFFPKLEKLEVLALKNSDADDACLQIIGKCCKNLRILNVNKCCRLTDTGVEWLVFQSSPELKKTLQELFIACPSVTKKGIKMAVQHFSALQVVENINIFDALVDVFESSAPDQLLPQDVSISFARLFIHSHAGVHKRGNIDLVIKHCPSLFDISIFVTMGLTDTDLFCLTNLKNLKLLKFYAHSSIIEDAITFDQGVAPVLKVIGSSLKVLNLSSFEFVDIWTIAKFCPNLISLTFENQCQSLSVVNENEIVQLRHEKGRVIFKELQFLACGFNLSNEVLFDLLSCPLLESVEITHCDMLNDDIFNEAMTNGILKNLEVLRLECCHFVTKQGIDRLMMSDNKLKKVSFFFCDMVTRANVSDWHTFARHKNWLLLLLFKDDGTELITYR